MTALSPPDGIRPRVLAIPRGPLAASYASPRTEATAGADAVVMVPGFVGSKEDFWPLLAGLAEAGHPAWAYDQLGQYETRADRGPADYTIELLAQDLRSVIARVGAPVHLIGHCLGGFVARAATLAGPAAVRSLTLVACGPSMREPRHRQILANLNADIDRGALESWWPFAKRIVPQSEPRTREHLRRKLSTANREFMRGAAWSLGREPDRCAELRASGTDVLVLHGTRDRRLWSRGDFSAMATRIGAQLTVIDRASHNPHREQTERTIDVLLEFWSRTAHPAHINTSR